MRYKVTGPWGGIKQFGSLFVQSADITDTRTHTSYFDGAYRVVDARKGMKPAKIGKGGTVPFFGDMAQSQAESLARDLAWAEQREAQMR